MIYIQPWYSAIQAGAAAEASELEKIAHYGRKLRPPVVNFTHYCSDQTLGGPLAACMETLTVKARRTVLITGTTIAKAIHYLLQQLSVVLWKFNAKLILNRLAVSMVEVDGDINDFV